MKTTLELPDALLRRAKVFAAQNDTTLRELVAQALERELDAQSKRLVAPFKPAHVVDQDGLPVLPRRGVIVSNGLVNDLRDEGGI